MDSEVGVVISAMAEDYVDGEDDDEEGEEDKLAESTQHSVSPNSQELFLTQMELPSQPSQATIPDNEAMEGTSAENFSSIPTPSRRLSQIRRWKKKTREEMFSEIMEVTHNEKAHLNEWKDVVAKTGKMPVTVRIGRMNVRVGGTNVRTGEMLKMRDGGTKISGGGMQLWGCCVIKLTCSGVWWNFRNGSRITECRCSPCITTLTMFHILLTQTCKNAWREAPCTCPLHPCGQPNQKAVITVKFF
ncbi:uncharacterized protein ACDP82_012343 [Pangshura tecta]